MPWQVGSSGKNAKPEVDCMKLGVASKSVCPQAVEYVRFDQSAMVAACVPLRLTAGMLTYWFAAAFAETAPPICPGTQVTPFTSVAVSPFPEASVALVPEPSSKGQ